MNSHLRRLIFLFGVCVSGSLWADSPPLVFYSNDTTHITSCDSPYRSGREGFSGDHLRASIREAAGVDAHLLQPGLGWIPWWKSNIYSPTEHYGTFLGGFGITKPNSYGRYLLEGGDVVATFLDECRKVGVKAIVSYRVNDGHHVRELAKALEEKKPSQGMSRFYWENYERFRIGPDSADWSQGVFDWSHPEVPAEKLALIRELIETYPLDGIELDFLRHWVRFAPDRTPLEERRAITTAFVREVRAALDAAEAKDGRERSLCLRVPAIVALHDEQGIHLPDLAGAGVDVVTLSWSYFTLQDDSVRKVKALIPATSVLVEMTHTTLTGKALGGSGTQPYLRTTDEQFYTTAHLAYEQGADGVSLFNFPYYRAHVIPEIGPFDEPPFHVLPKLRDREFVARQPHCYFLTAARKDVALRALPLAALLQRNQPQTFTMEMAPTAGVHRDGLLRLRSDESIADRVIEVKVNGTLLEPAPFTAKSLPHRYEAWLGTAEDSRCFHCPIGLVKQGNNEIEVTLREGIRVRIIYLEVALPAEATPR
ncbi:MAG: hypothetical protein JNJ70_12695 [Verrucomicrobiales bacterium]|nr:hypothetical protein [Verrucomicrobiales bacterium]